MSVKCWIRVDDRLLHGQVTVAWRQYLRYDEVWIVDDQVRLDPFLVDVLRVVTPADVTLNVYSVVEAIAAASPFVRRECSFQDVASDMSDLASSLDTGEGQGRERVFVLVKSPLVALVLFEEGFPIPSLNVGNLAAKPGSKRVFKTISLTSQDVATLDTLVAHGVRVTFQLTPEDVAVDWQAIKRRL